MKVTPRKGSCIALLLLLAAVTHGLAKDGRDFAGFYQVSDVTDLGDQFRVTLRARFTNYSDADVSNAKVTLTNPACCGEAYGSVLALVTVRARESIQVSGIFTIPRPLFESWENGDHPQLQIEFETTPGNPTQRWIELSPSPTGEEE